MVMDRYCYTALVLLGRSRYPLFFGVRDLAQISRNVGGAEKFDKIASLIKIRLSDCQLQRSQDALDGENLYEKTGRGPADAGTTVCHEQKRRQNAIWFRWPGTNGIPNGFQPAPQSCCQIDDDNIRH